MSSRASSNTYSGAAIARLLIGVLLAFACWLGASSARALDVPALTARVNDYADLLSPQAEQRIEQRLAAFEQSTGHQFAVLTVPSLEGDSLEEFSIRVVEKWKLGQKGKDDGLLLLVAKQERKVRIEVGYGLEGDITDAFSAQLIRNVLTPAFKRGDYEGGIEEALRLAIAKAGGQDVELPPEPSRQRSYRQPHSRVSGTLILLLFAIPFVLSLFFRGGGRGGGGGGFLSGLLLGLLSGSSSRGGWSSGGSSWGGGGGWSGGGGGGGGWGGGGGGGFGGGGASGEW